ncbi:MAG: hypothetical protein AB8G14_13830 [Ilumatobacter sp.]
MPPILVHIIYTPGTVTKLLPFAKRLVAHSSARFALVTNGSSPEEVEQLHSYASSLPDRIRLIDLHTNEMLEHGDIVEQLLDQLPEEESVLAFVDSDIFASGPVDLDLLRPRNGEAARCSGLAIWQTPEDQVAVSGFEIISGRHLRIDNGVEVCCTYAAAYDAAVLRRTLTRWNIGLGKYLWDDVPAKVQHHLTSIGARFEFYDTGKVASLMVQHEGHRVQYVDIDNFVHIGALSGTRRTDSAPATTARRIVDFVRSPRDIAKKIAKRVPGTLANRERASIDHLVERRLAACELVDALAAGDPNPPVPSWCSDLVLSHLRELVPPVPS